MSLKPKVLIIDDSDIDNEYLELLITIESIDVDYIIKPNGIAGIKYLKDCSIDLFPDIILVDINMPLMDGFEFVSKYEVLFYDKFPDSKIFIMSSTRRLSEIEEAKKLKVVADFLEKPITNVQFGMMIKNE